MRKIEFTPRNRITAHRPDAPEQSTMSSVEEALCAGIQK